jgi:hypothetical protein
LINKFKICLISAVLLSHGLFGQKCDCKKELLYAKSKISRNYAGFRDKVSTNNFQAYQKHTSSFLKSSKRISDPFHCVAHINQWLQFFEEENIKMDIKTPDFDRMHSDSIVRYFSHTRTLSKWTPQKVKAYLSDNSNLDPIEGIWENNRKTYVTAIIKDQKSKKNTNFLGVILEADGAFWSEGMVKLEIRKCDNNYVSDFYYKNHDPKILEVNLINEAVLEFNGLTQWVKTFPAMDAGLTNAFNKNYYQENNLASTPIFTIVDTSTSLLKIPSFEWDIAPTIDSLVNANRTDIISSENLIIDLRGNREGSDFSFLPLMQLIYTNPIYTDGIKILASPDNIFSWEVLLTNPKFSPEIKLRIRELVAQMKLNENGFVEVPGETTTFDQPLKMPSKVAIIADETCAGACEQFLILAKQSSKVTLLGANTAGVVDYNYMRSSPMLCLPYLLKYATSSSMRLPLNPINATGIAPDIQLEGGNWVAIAADHLREK